MAERNPRWGEWRPASPKWEPGPPKWTPIAPDSPERKKETLPGTPPRRPPSGTSPEAYKEPTTPRSDMVEQVIDLYEVERQKLFDIRSPGNQASSMRSIKEDFYIHDQPVYESDKGKIYRIVEKETGKPFAMQILESKRTKYGRDKMKINIGVSRRLKAHPAFAIYYRYYTCPDILHRGQFIDIGIMEMFHEDLAARIRRLEVMPTEQEAQTFMEELLDAVNFMHNNGFAHRDLCPENILMRDEHKLSNIAITDFDEGMLLMEGSRPPFTFTSPTGWINTAAPELMEILSDHFVHKIPSDRCYSEKVDIFAVGIIMYYILSGKYPFTKGCGNHSQFNGSCDRCYSQRERDIRDMRTEPTFCRTIDGGAISPLCLDLLEALMQYDPDERVSAAEALEFEWITNKNLSAQREAAQKLPTGQFEMADPECRAGSSIQHFELYGIIPGQKDYRYIDTLKKAILKRTDVYKATQNLGLAYLYYKLDKALYLNKVNAPTMRYTKCDTEMGLCSVEDYPVIHTHVHPKKAHDAFALKIFGLSLLTSWTPRTPRFPAMPMTEGGNVIDVDEETRRRIRETRANR